MSNPPNNRPSAQPAPLPPPQQYQQQNYGPYPYNNPYYTAYYNPAYPQTQQSHALQQPPLPPSAPLHMKPNISTNIQPPPHPPPPPQQSAYNLYYNQAAAAAAAAAPYTPPFNNTQNVSFTWNRTASRTVNNPPPPPPKPLISPNHERASNNPQSNAASALFSHLKPQTKLRQQMVSSSSSSWNHNKNELNHKKESDGEKDQKATHPAALTEYFEKCLQRLRQMPSSLATPQNRDKLQKQLKMRLKEARKNDTVFTTDWNREAFPPVLRYLITISNISSLQKKRKANNDWNQDVVIRKVAKTSVAHRAVHQDRNAINRFLEESPPPRFVNKFNTTKRVVSKKVNKSNKSDSDMSCSDSASCSPVKHYVTVHHSSEEDTEIEEYEEEAYVLSKGRGFTTRKVTKTRKKKKNKKKKKKKKKKEAGFRWDKMDVDDMDTSADKKEENLAEMTRILERKKRFEAQEDDEDDNNKWSVSTNTDEKKKGAHLAMNGALSRDMQQLMDWHEKRVVGTCTKVEKDYFRLTSEPNTNEVRTLDTMKKAFNLLMIRWKRKHKKDYLYVGGQFKSLRQDLRVQHIRNKFSVKVYEENAKICLEVGDLSEYNQCQGQIKELYHEQESEDMETSTNYIQFLCYRLLYEAVTKNFYGVSCIIKREKKYCGHQEIVNTLKIIQAIQRMDYNTFFVIYKKLRHHAQCILDQISYKVRYHALCIIAVSYCPSLYPVKQLRKTIGFEDEKECVEYLKHTGCVLNNNNNNELMFNCKASRGKIKEFVPKSEDDELGVTHGSVYHDKNQDETSIAKFLRKN